jgi:hypothetical protein
LARAVDRSNAERDQRETQAATRSRDESRRALASKHTKKDDAAASGPNAPQLPAADCRLPQPERQSAGSGNQDQPNSLGELGNTRNSNPAQATADLAAQSAPAVTDPQNTAFLARVQLAQSVDGGSPLQAELASAAVDGIRKVAEATAPAMSGGQDATPLTALAGIASEDKGSTTTEPVSESQIGPPRAAEIAARIDDQPKSTEPLHSISVELSGPGAEKVTVRMVQQPGELRMAVRTDNPELNRGLQQGLSDLVGKLQEHGFRAETWKPVHAAQEASSAPESQGADHQFRQPDPQSQSGGSQQESGQRRQNQSNRPRWVAELESSLAGQGKS